MRKIIVITLLAVFMAALILTTGFTSAEPDEEISISVRSAIESLGVSEGELKFVSQTENVYGDKQLTYSDDNYNYYMDMKTAELIMLHSRLIK